MVLRAFSAFVLVSFLVAWSTRVAKAEELMLGFYDFPDMSDLALLSGTPFEYVIPYGSEGADMAYLERYLHSAAQEQIKIIFSLKDLHKRSKWYPRIKWCEGADGSELAGCIANRFDSNEAVFGWYIADEPSVSWGKLNWVKLKSNALNVRKVSSKPIMINDKPFPAGVLWDYLNECSDILMTHTYPVPEGSLMDMYHAVNGLTSRFKKPVIAVVQTHGKHQYAFTKTDEISGRAPTIDEIRVMSYLALIGGAKGIIYYSLFDLKKMPDFEARFMSMKLLAEELRKHYPLLSSNQRVVVEMKADRSEMFAKLRRFKNEDYLILINPTKNKLSYGSLVGGERLEVQIGSVDVKVIQLGAKVADDSKAQ